FYGCNGASVYPLIKFLLYVESMTSGRKSSPRPNLLESLIGVTTPRTSKSLKSSKVKKHSSVKPKRTLAERISKAPVLKKRTLEERISRPLAERIGPV